MVRALKKPIETGKLKIQLIKNQDRVLLNYFVGSTRESTTTTIPFPAGA